MIASIGRPRNTDLDIALLGAAEELILERGFGGLFVGAIASSAGTTRPAFYRRFDGIPALVLALLLDRFAIDLDLSINSGNLPEDLTAIQREQLALFSHPLVKHGLAGFWIPCSGMTRCKKFFCISFWLHAGTLPARLSYVLRDGGKYLGGRTWSGPSTFSPAHS